MRVLIVPDSFKGCASSQLIADCMRRGVLRARPDAQTVCVPMADGGEGTVDAVLSAMAGQRVIVTVRGPLGHPVEACYAKLGSVAVVEMAQAAGLSLAAGEVERASTYGVGRLIDHALSHGASRVVLGLGGSGTNDGGCGMAAALGARFIDGSGRAFLPTGATLCEIAGYEPGPRLPVEAMCDVDNPLFGPTGAAYVYGPQKGAADPSALDAGLRRLAAVCGGDPDMPGAGAAGGMGYGVAVMLGGRLASGVDMLLDIAEFDKLIQGADLVLTGEGRIDGQTARGKVPVGVARRARPFGVPVVALCGSLAVGYEAVYSEGITAVFSTTRLPCTLEEAIARTPDSVEALTCDIVRLID